MTALSKPGARADASEADGRLRLLRELGAQAVPTWAALEEAPGERARLVVVERANRSAFEDGEIADWVRDARRLSTLDHPNLARVRDVVIRSREILVVSDFVDGVRWKEFGPTTSLETALRVLVDALTGLSGLHNVRDASDPKRPLFKLVHGGLTPDCIIVGLDGVARVAGAARLRSATARLAGTGSAYLAPEVLLEDDSADARADVYSIGVMLWEALSRRRFLPNLQPSAIVTQLLSGRVPPVTLPEGAPWAAPLGDVVTRALSADPEKRFTTAAAMAAEVRRIGGLKLPLAIRVATAVRERFGDAAKTRREMLERGEVRASEVSLLGPTMPSDARSVDVADEILEERPSSQTASTVPPPGLAPEDVPAIEPLGSVTVVAASPAPVAVAPPPKPVAVAPPPKPVAVAPPPKPVAVAPPPPPPVAVAPSPPPVAVAPPSPPVAVAPSPPPVAVAPPPPPPRAAVAPPPKPAPAVVAPPPDPPPPEVITAAPFALATPAIPEVREVRPGLPRGVLGFAAAGAAVLAIGVTAWWIASRGSEAHPAVVQVATPAPPAAPPASASEPVLPIAAAPPATPDPPPAADVPPPTAPASTIPKNEPTPGARAFPPPPPNTLTPRPKRHTYDPQGI